MNILNKFSYFNGHVLKYLLKNPTTHFRYTISSAAFSTKANNLSDIKYDELKDKLVKKEILLIDVRNPNEREEDGFIPGSINIPLVPLGNSILLSPEEFTEKFGFPKPALDAPLATSCILGVRAQTAQLALIGAGYSNVSCYRGSFEDWKQNEGPIEK